MKQFLFSLLLFCVLSYRVIAGKKIKEKEVQKAGDGHGRDALFSTTSLDAVHSSEISPYFNDKSKVKTQNDTMGWLSKSTRKKARSYATTFKEASLFPHIAINNFMTPAAAEALLAEFPSFESGNYMNEYGVPGKKSIQPNLRTISNTYAKLWKYIGSEEFLSYVSKVTGIPDLMMDPSMFGGGTHENLKGQKLNTHIDFNYSRDKRWHRRVNVLYYLNKDWDCKWGGCVIFEKDPLCFEDHCNPKKEYKVEFNRAVIFATSEKSWHGFKEIKTPDTYKGSRKLISIYLYTRDRPAAETAAEHSTFYIPTTKLQLTDEKLYFKDLLQQEVSLHQQIDTQAAEMHKLVLNKMTDLGKLKHGLELLKLDGFFVDGWTNKNAYMDMRVNPGYKVRTLTMDAFWPNVVKSANLELSIFAEQGHKTWKVGGAKVGGVDLAEQGATTSRKLSVSINPENIEENKSYVLSIHMHSDKILPKSGGDMRELAFIMSRHGLMLR